MRVRSTLLLVSTLATTAVPFASAQSLADAAKKAEESRKATKQPARVYTNKDLKPVPPPAAAAEQEEKSATETAAGPEKSDKAANENAGPGEAAADAAKKPEYWRKRLADLQTALDRDQTYLDAVQSRVNALTTDFVNRDDPAQRAVIERERNRNLSELQRLQKAIEADRKAIADFEEEARRAGIPPGWLR